MLFRSSVPRIPLQIVLLRPVARSNVHCLIANNIVFWLHYTAWTCHRADLVGPVVGSALIDVLRRALRSVIIVVLPVPSSVVTPVLFPLLVADSRVGIASRACRVSLLPLDSLTESVVPIEAGMLLLLSIAEGVS